MNVRVQVVVVPREAVAGVTLNSGRSLAQVQTNRAAAVSCIVQSFDI